MEQQSFNQPNYGSDMDTVTFIQTLTPDLREDILLTLSNELLD